MGYRAIISSKIELLVSSIAIRKVGASPALAEVIVLFAGSELERSEFGALMRAVAERLVLGEATCTVVVILADFELDPKWGRQYCLGHLSTAHGSVIFFFSSSVAGALRWLDWSQPIQITQ